MYNIETPKINRPGPNGMSIHINDCERVLRRLALSDRKTSDCSNRYRMYANNPNTRTLRKSLIDLTILILPEP